MINGRSVPAGSGSYFYQSKDEDGSEVVFFGPNYSFWTYKDERTEDCIFSLEPLTPAVAPADRPRPRALRP